MAHQILGIRPENGHAFFERGWRAPSVEELFRDLGQYLALIPEQDRWNLYFTPADCGEAPREFKSQSVLHLDIDKIDLERIEDTVLAVLKVLSLEGEKTGITCSGNGLQFFIKLDEEITEKKFFKENKNFYKYMCARINAELNNQGLKGFADPAVFDARRLMRLPGTENRKPHGVKQAYMIQWQILPQGVTLRTLSGVPSLASDQQVNPARLKNFRVDEKTVIKECNFLKRTKENQEKVTELEWYAVASFFARMENGREFFHKWSEKHPKYSKEETDLKFDQARDASGPRTCKNIESLTDQSAKDCQGCKHYKSHTVKSPISIQGDDFIKTKSTGFYDIIEKDGQPVSFKPNYNDLLKHFKQTHDYFVNPESQNIYIYNGKYWEEIPHLEVKHFAEKHFLPKPTDSMRREFLSKILCNNLRTSHWAAHSADRKINLQNGIYDIEKDEIVEHSANFFFTGILPYEYDRAAKAPKFEKFMREITQNRQDLIDLLLEYSGYAISGDQCWVHKALILYGDGRNGKSTFMEILKSVVGEGLYAALSLSAIEDDRKRYMLDGKLFNVGEETHVSALSKSESFKTLVSGGEMDIRRLYQQPYLFRNKAKLIFSCNTLPYSSDNTDGFYRRLVIVPFDAKFTPGAGENKNLKEELLEELPGILNLFVGAYKRLKKQGDFSDSVTAQAQATEYRNDNDMVYAWFHDYVEVSPGGFVSSSELFSSFSDYFEKQRLPFKYSMQQFGKWMKKNLPEGVEEARQRSGNGSYQRGYTNLKLLSDF